MKRILGIGLLTAAFLATLCACGNSGTDTNQGTSAPNPAASADVTDAGSEQQATLYLMTDGEEQGQYALDYSGELTAEQLLQGLTNLTGYHFDAEKVETNGKNITVFWADTASFFSDTGTKAEATAELAFQDFASQLQFMLDSTYITLTKNLDVTNVYYVTSTGTPLDFTEQANWTLSADQFYSGTFGDYYLDETTDGGDASNPDKDGKEFIFLDQRADPAASGADLSPEAAAQSVYDALVLDYKGDTDEREWVIALDEITQVDGSEAYAFSVGQGTEETFDTYFHAAITYDGNVYMMENGASEYSSYDQPET